MKKSILSKTVSVCLAVCMVINLCYAFPVSAGMVERDNSKLVFPTNETDTGILPENVSSLLLSDAELEALATSGKDFSDLTEDEKDLFCDHFRVNPDVMAMCEQAGYALEESIDMAKIFQVVDMPPALFEKMVQVYGDRNLALAEAKKFANYRYVYPSFEMGEDPACITYLVTGNSADEIVKARQMAEVLDMDIADTADFSYQSDGTALGDIAEQFHTKKEVLTAHIAMENMEEATYIDQVEQMLGVENEAVAMQLSTTTISGEAIQYDPLAYPNAPYSYVQNGAERITESTGAVGYVETEAVLPGKNGLNLTVGARYDSAKSSKFIIGCSGGENFSADKPQYSPLSSFAPGWDFTWSYILCHEEGFEMAYPVYVSADGTTMNISNEDVYDENLEEIGWANLLLLKEIRLYKDSSYTHNGVTSMFSTKYKDGKKEYFDDNGKLMKIENRYGDSIVFTYLTNDTETDDSIDQFNKVQITDTLNQITTIEKTAKVTETDENGNTVNYYPVVITLPDGKTITYRLRGITHPDSSLDEFTRILDSKTNAGGLTTKFAYIENDLSNFDFVGDSSKMKSHAYYPLTSITHPTGLVTQYVYEKYEPENDYYRVKERYDEYNRQNYTQILNKMMYSYAKTYMDSIETYEVTYTNADGLSVKNTFKEYSNDYTLKVSNDVYYTVDETNVAVSRTEYSDYFYRVYPQMVTKRIYNQQNAEQYIQTIEKYEYDLNGNCIKYWSPYANGDTANTEYLTTNTYDEQYHYLIGSTYKKDANTTIREEYVPTADRKNIAEANVYYNDALVSKIVYSYGENSGYPSGQTVYRSTTEGDSVTTTYEYLNNTFKTKETTNGKATQYAYDIYGNVLSVVDPKGNTTTYAYDNLGRTTRITYPDNSLETWEYQVSFGENTYVNRIYYMEQSGNILVYDYDALGRLKEVYDPQEEAYKVAYSYNTLVNQLMSVWTGEGDYIHYAYDKVGRMTEAGFYDAADEDLDYQETYTYQPAYDTNTSKVTTIVGTGTNVIKTAVYTDKYGNVVREDVGDTGKMTESKGYTYDYLGNQVAETFRETETGQDLVRSSVTVTPIANQGLLTTTQDYYGTQVQNYTNMAGQPKETTDQYGTRRVYTYNADGWLSADSVSLQGDVSTTSYIYDNNGNVTQEGITTHELYAETPTYRYVNREYDNMNRPTKEWSIRDQETRYTYDTAGNLKTVTTNLSDMNEVGAVITYTYDDQNRLTRMIDKSNIATDYTYDMLDRVSTKTDGNGSVHQYTYDAMGNILSDTVTNGANTDTITYTYGTHGLMTSAANINGTISFAYNQKGEKTGETVTGVLPHQKSYTYDTDGNMTNVTVNCGDSTVYQQNYTYNRVQQLTKVNDGLTNTDLATYMYYFGLLERITYPNGILRETLYDGSNAISTLGFYSNSNTQLPTVSFRYYTDGNLHTETDGYTEDVRTYTYDRENRLTSESVTQNGSTKTQTYRYDFGNRYTKTVDGIMSDYGTFRNDDRMDYEYWPTSDSDNDWRYTYDNNGNTLKRRLNKYILYSPEDNTDLEVEEFTYTLRNQVSTFKRYTKELGETESSLDKEASYLYDALGRRIQKTVNNVVTKYIWEGDKIIYEAGAQTVRYAYDQTGALALTNGSGTYYMLKNTHGDVINLTDSTGAVAASYSYDAFGVQADDTSAIYNPFRYAGEYYDEESELIYLRARYYDPNIGRFLTQDPAQDGWNWYVYCNNNPVMFVDPSGLIKEGDEKLNDSIQIILNGTLKDGSGGLSLAWELADTDAERKAISEMADKIRGFNADGINRHMILINTEAAFGAGHTATLLLNENDQGLLFSYYSENGEAIDNGQMRIAFLNSTEWNGLLYENQSFELVASNGTIQSESYDGNLYLTVSSDNGKKGLEEIAILFNNPGEYNLADHNCDHMTSSVAAAAGIFYDKRVLPNDSFTYTQMYHTNYWLWVLDSAMQTTH